MQHRNTHLGAAVIAAIALALGVVSITGPARAQDKQVFSVGTTQDIDSINPLVGALVIDYEIWNLQYATVTDKAARGLLGHPRPGRVVGDQRRRADRHLHLPRGLAVERR